MSRRMARLILQHDGDVTRAVLALQSEHRAARESKLKPQKVAVLVNAVVAKKTELEPSLRRESLTSRGWSGGGNWGNARSEAKVNAHISHADAGSHTTRTAHRGTNMKTSLSKEQALAVWKKSLRCDDGKSDAVAVGSASATGGESKMTTEQVKACWKKTILSGELP